MSEKISSLLNKSKSLSENIKESSEILTDKTEISPNASDQIQKAVTEIAIKENITDILLDFHEQI